MAIGMAAPAQAALRRFTVGWSVYAGWNPYFYMAKSGILKKWADKYGVVIKVQRFDYAASLDAFVGKNIDACTMTNMEALDMPAAAGVDSTAVIVGDYSNGNDAVLARNNLDAGATAGQAHHAGAEDGFGISAGTGDGCNGLGAADSAIEADEYQRFRSCGSFSRQSRQPGCCDLEAAGFADSGAGRA
jgi:hypothetical protein